MIDSQGDEVPEVFGVAPGPAVAAALASGVAGIETLELSEASRGHLVDLAVAAEKVKAWAATMQAKVTAALVEQFETAHEAVCTRDQEVAHERALEATTLSLSLALGVSLRAADQKLSLALALERHAALARALEVGRIDEGQARLIGRHAEALAPGQAEQLVAAIVTDPADPDTASESRAGLARELRDGTRTVWSIPAHQLRPILTAAVAELAPETVQDATVTNQRGRHVAHYASTVDRPGALVLHGPDHDLAAVHAHLDAQARAARKTGAPETLDQLRFDLAVGHLTGGAFGLTLVSKSSGATSPARDTHAKKRRRRLRSRQGATLINVTVADRTLLGLDDTPAVLHTPSGNVPIPAELARALAHDPEQATWRRILCDPATGTAIDVSSGYRPAPRIAQYCAVRDGRTSRFPTSAARTLELDHIEEFDHTAPADGGATTAANLAAAGKRDHQAKTDRLVDVTGDANVELTYTTGTGHSYRSRPYQYLDNGDPPY